MRLFVPWAVLLLGTACMSPLPSTLADGDGEWVLTGYTYERRSGSEVVATFEADETGTFSFTAGEKDIEDGFGYATWWEPVLIDDVDVFVPVAEGFSYHTHKDGTMQLSWHSGHTEDWVPVTVDRDRVVAESESEHGQPFPDQIAHRTWELTR